MWLIFALLSAVFAALTSILAKVGIDGVNSNLATAIRTAVVLAMSWLMVFITNAQSGIGSIGRKSWIFFDSFRFGDRRFVVMLLSRVADRRGIKGSSDR